MKRVFTFVLTLCVSIIVLGSNTQVGGIYFEFDQQTKTASVTYQGTTFGTAYYSGIVTIPETVTYRRVVYQVVSIGDYAFANSTQLKEVIIPTTVTQIGNSAFRGCSSLTSVVIPESVTQIGSYAFNAATALETIIIPNSVTSVGEGLFDHCSALKNVTLPDNITTLGNYSFQFCHSLISVILPHSLKEVSNSLFRQCTSLNSITIPEYVELVGDYAFAECSALQTVNFEGHAVKTISINAFDGCSTIEKIAVPEGVNTIDNKAFQNCASLKEITLPSTLLQIGNAAFQNCTTIENIYSDAITPPDVNNSFHNINPNVVVYVPCGSESAYQAKWSELANNIQSNLGIQFTAISSNNDWGTVQIIQQPTCDNHSAVVEANPAEGYAFDVWSDGFRENPHTVNINNTQQLIGYFKEIPQLYTIDFYNNNTLYHTQQLHEGDPILGLIANPEPPQECYAFARWIQSNGAGCPTVMPKNNLQLYAHYDLAKYNITYVGLLTNENGETIGETEPKEVEWTCGNEITYPTADEIEGYTFTGWENKPENDIMPAHDIMITGKYEPIIVLYTLTIYNGTTLLYQEQLAAGTVYSDKLPETVEAPDECSAFVGWTPQQTDYLMPEHDLTLYALFNTLQNTITYQTYLTNADGEIVGENEPTEVEWLCGNEITYPTADEIEGYTFTGWEGKPTGDIMPAENIVIIGKYEPIIPETYNLVIIVDDETIYANSFEAGDEIIDIPSIPLEYCESIEWDKEIPSVMPAEDVTCKAIISSNQHSVQYYINGSDGSELFYTDYVCEGDEITTIEVPDREGYEFYGWKMLDDEPIPDMMPNEDIQLYGEYNALTQFQLTWISNNEIVATTFVYSGNAVVLPETPTAPNEEFNIFAGWYTEPSGLSTEPTTALSGEQITEHTIPTADATYYAIWKNSNDEYISIVCTISAVENLSYEIDGSSLVLSWDTPAEIENISELQVYDSQADEIIRTLTPQETEYIIRDISECNTYTYSIISVSANGCTNSRSIVIEYNKTALITYYDANLDVYTENAADCQHPAVVLPSISRTHSTFLGWFTTPTGGELVGLAGDEYTPTEQKTSLYSQWQDDALYTLIFTDAEGNTLSQTTLYAGDIITDIPEIEVGECETLAWEPSVPDAMPQNDLTIKAVITSHKHTISYILHDITKYPEGDTTIVELCYQTPVRYFYVSRQGYEFSGWKLSNGSNGPEYMPDYDINLYGILTPIETEKYTITFCDENGVPLEGVLYSQQLEAGAEISMPADPTKEDCEFIKWIGIPDDNVMPARDLSVRAQFDCEVCQIPNLIVVSANSTQGSAQIDKAATCEDMEVEISATANDGYLFTMWNDGNTDNPRTFTLTEQTVLVANFEVDEPILDIQSYKVIIHNNDATMGYVEARIRFEATAEDGYRFSKWDDGNVINPSIVELDEDNQLVTRIATFITATDNPRRAPAFRNISAGQQSIIFAGHNDEQVDIFDRTGQIIYSGKAQPKISVPESGLYMIRINHQIGIIEVK